MISISALCMIVQNVSNGEFAIGKVHRLENGCWFVASWEFDSPTLRPI